MKSDSTLELALTLMDGYARRTGLKGDVPQQRYLFTDAYAVHNFMGLAKILNDEHYSSSGLRLIHQVHQVLGRFRGDDHRNGWISGLSGNEGERRPTLRGLRIGKMLPEKKPGDAGDERLDDDRDGQYLHYLTKWISALNSAGRTTKISELNFWAQELATACCFFMPQNQDDKILYRKMSTDLSRPLEIAASNFDALEGYIVCLELQVLTRSMGISSESNLEQTTGHFGALLVGLKGKTTDEMILGCLLDCLYRVANLMLLNAVKDFELVDSILEALTNSLEEYSKQKRRKHAGSRRVAFREIGLSIGLASVGNLIKMLPNISPSTEIVVLLEKKLLVLTPYLIEGRKIVEHWMPAAGRKTGAWLEYRNINDVMFATRLLLEEHQEGSAVTLQNS